MPIRTREPPVAAVAGRARRSTLLIRASSSRGSNGLGKVVVGPGLQADDAIHLSPAAVTMMMPTRG